MNPDDVTSISYFTSNETGVEEIVIEGRYSLLAWIKEAIRTRSIDFDSTRTERWVKNGNYWVNPLTYVMADEDKQYELDDLKNELKNWG